MTLPAQCHVRATIPSAPLDGTRFRPVENHRHPRAKPAHGLWTSTWDEECGSEWVKWCIAEEFECSRADPSFASVWLLTPDSSARVYEIDSYEDLARLVDAFPHAKSYPDRGWGAWTEAFPDWERVATEYDAVRVTDDGQWATRLSAPLNLYSWDCESTLWFRWAFESAVDLGRRSYPVLVEELREAV